MKIALVTGSTSGIGYEISKRLLKMNYTVYGIGRNFIKNNENIEMVLKLDNKAKNKKEKVKIAGKFIMEKSKEKYLGIEEPEKTGIGSNIFKILDILESEV